MNDTFPCWRKKHDKRFRLLLLMLGLLFVTYCSSDSGGGTGDTNVTYIDTDGDTISDSDEGLGIDDTDSDGIFDTEDLDSDGDGILDADEAGDTDLLTAPVDTDGDGLADFRDTDSDNDGLTDHQEKFDYDTAPTNSDSDGDGASDLVEVEVGTDPLEETDNPKEQGDFAFLSSYGKAPDPAQETLSYLWDQVGAIDITAARVDDGSDSVDAVTAFLDNVVTNSSAGAPCASGLVTTDFDADGSEDTFQVLAQNTEVCFDVIPRKNSSVQRTDTPQMFKATVQIWGDHVTLLDTHDLYFVVPPEIPGSGQ